MYCLDTFSIHRCTVLYSGNRVINNSSLSGGDVDGVINNDGDVESASANRVVNAAADFLKSIKNRGDVVSVCAARNQMAFRA